MVTLKNNKSLALHYKIFKIEKVNKGSKFLIKKSLKRY